MWVWSLGCIGGGGAILCFHASKRWPHPHSVILSPLGNIIIGVCACGGKKKKKKKNDALTMTLDMKPKDVQINL